MNNYSNSAIKYYTGDQLLKLKIQKPMELVEGLIRKSSLNVIFGESGCGKSILSMNLMFSIATGKEKFLKYNICHPGKVLFLNNEIPLPEFVERFNAMSNIIDLENPLLNNIIVPNFVPPIEEYEPELSKLIITENINFVILDCLYWSHDKKENDNTEIKPLMRKLVKLRDDHSISILIIHHDKKGSKNMTMHNDNMRGASVITNAADAVFELRRSGTDPSIRLFKPTKLRYSSDNLSSARILDFNPSSLWFKDIGIADEADHIIMNPNTTIGRKRINILDLIKSGEFVSRKEFIERYRDAGYTGSERTIDRDLRDAVDANKLCSTGKGEYYL